MSERRCIDHENSNIYGQSRLLSASCKNCQINENVAEPQYFSLFEAP